MRFQRSSNQVPSPLIRFIFGRLFPLPFAIVGAVLLFIGSRALLDARASSAWPTVAGKVVASNVESSSGDDGTSYSAEVMYEYEVEGITYSSNRVAFGDYGSSNPSHAREIVNRYPKNADVTVAHKPADPGNSVLEVGVQWQAFFVPVFGLVFFTIGCLMLVFLPGLMRKQANAGEPKSEDDSMTHARFGDDL